MLLRSDIIAQRGGFLCVKSIFFRRNAPILAAKCIFAEKLYHMYSTAQQSAECWLRSYGHVRVKHLPIHRAARYNRANSFKYQQETRFKTTIIWQAAMRQAEEEANQMSYRMFTDATSDLPPAFAEQLKVTVLPMGFTMEGKGIFLYSRQVGYAHRAVFCQDARGRRRQYRAGQHLCFSRGV